MSGYNRILVKLFDISAGNKRFLAITGNNHRFSIWTFFQTAKAIIKFVEGFGIERI